MRELSTRVNIDAEHLVDTCGTGGDGSSIFNVSTASSFVVAAGGATVAKHGNRSVTSVSGSADVLEAAGVNLDLNAEQVGRCIEEIGLGFMFAVKHHGAMKYAIGPRRELAARTIFNLLGPITNPAGAPNQVLGVYDKAWLRPMAQVLQRLGSEHVMVVHAEDGLDEISIASATHVAELKDGKISEYSVAPEDFGLERQALDSLVVSSAEASLALIKAVFSGEDCAAADIVALNAGAALYVSGQASSLKEGVNLAQDLIASGQAKEKFSMFVEFTQLC
jgi:anthranilate phosphoribosyltransferase